MPRRAPPPDVEAVDARLSMESEQFLAYVAGVLGRRVDELHRIRPLFDVIASVEAFALAREVQAVEREDWRCALTIAGERLGMNDETLRTRYERWVKACADGCSL